MGSAKGGGGANQSHDYYGTLMGLGGIGAILSIEAALLDGNLVWGVGMSGGAALVYNGGSIGDGYVLTIPGFGPIEIHWGLETQAASSVLNQYEDHPPYKEFWYVVPVNCLFGTEKTVPPTLELIVTSVPLQSIVTGASALLDSNDQANSVAIAAEYATGWHGLQLDASQINIPSFQATADAIRTDAYLAQLANCSPLVINQAAARAVFGDMQSLCDLWFRFDADGNLECGRWLREGPAGSVTIITANEWTTPPADSTNDITTIPNGFDVVIDDETQLYNETSIPTNNPMALALGANANRVQLQRKFITSAAQGAVCGIEAVRLQGVPTVSGKVVVRATQAVNPDGSNIRPGDYFLLDTEQEPGGLGELQLCRCTGRVFDPESPITLEYEYDPSAAPTPYVVPFTINTPADDIIPPIYYQRTLSLQPAVGEYPSIFLLALRHKPQWIGAQVFYCATISGDYALLGSQIGFALPVKLYTAVGQADTTITVNTVPSFATGVPGDIDAHWLTDAVNSDTAARNNELLLVVLKKDVTTGVQLMDGALPILEVCSISDVSVVGSSQYALTVLRGRMNTIPRAFNTGTFPDPFLNYEGWVIPRALLQPLKHTDFASLVDSGAAGYFEFSPFTIKGNYDPATAYAAGLQATPGWLPVWSYVFPAGFNNSPTVAISAPFTGAATDTAGAITLTVAVTDPNADLAEISAFSSFATDGSHYALHFDQKVNLTGTFNWTGTITIPAAEGVHTITVLAKDTSGLTTKKTVNIYRAVSSPTFTLNPPRLNPPPQQITGFITVTMTAPSGSSGTSQIQWSLDQGVTWLSATAGSSSATASVAAGSPILSRMKDGAAYSAIVANYYGNNISGSGQAIP